MTCVVAVTDGKKVCMAGDSGAVDESSITISAVPKVFTKGEFIIGYCHSFRLGQIIQHIFTPPALPANKTITDDALISYMVKKFVPDLKRCLDENNFPYHDDEKNDWELLVGVRGRIFNVQDDWQVGIDILPYAAIGSGSPYALGALFINQDITAALDAASRFSPFVCPPYTILEK